LAPCAPVLSSAPLHDALPILTFRGPAELRPVLEAYKAAFPDLRHDVVASVEGSDSIAVEIHITMTHTGTFTTPMGAIPPTGNTVDRKSTRLNSSHGSISYAVF